MSSKERRPKSPDVTDFDDIDPSLLSARNESRRVRKINPLGLRVVVRIAKDSNVSEGGLYLPEGAKQALMDSVVAEVVEVASAVDSQTDEETNVSGIPLGAHVLLPKTAGVKVPWDDALRVVETRDILAIVEEILIT